MFKRWFVFSIVPETFDAHYKEHGYESAEDALKASILEHCKKLVKVEEQYRRLKHDICDMQALLVEYQRNETMAERNAAMLRIDRLKTKLGFW